MNSSDAARKWFASIEWAESERNYLADHVISRDLQDAIDDALISAFVAGARWAAEVNTPLLKEVTDVI